MMKKVMKKVAAHGKKSARRAFERMETEVMAAVGRKTVHNKVKVVRDVGLKAAKAGLSAGALAAAGAIVREVRRRKDRAWIVASG